MKHIQYYSWRTPSTAGKAYSTAVGEPQVLQEKHTVLQLENLKFTRKCIQYYSW
jgi:hypothetical protein